MNPNISNKCCQNSVLCTFVSISFAFWLEYIHKCPHIRDNKYINIKYYNLLQWFNVFEADDATMTFLSVY